MNREDTLKMWEEFMEFLLLSPEQKQDRCDFGLDKEEVVC